MFQNITSNTAKIFFSNHWNMLIGSCIDRIDIIFINYLHQVFLDSYIANNGYKFDIKILFKAPDSSIYNAYSLISNKTKFLGL